MKNVYQKCERNAQNLSWKYWIIELTYFSGINCHSSMRSDYVRRSIRAKVRDACAHLSTILTNKYYVMHNFLCCSSIETSITESLLLKSSKLWSPHLITNNVQTMCNNIIPLYLRCASLMRCITPASVLDSMVLYTGAKPKTHTKLKLNRLFSFVLHSIYYNKITPEVETPWLACSIHSFWIWARKISYLPPIFNNK